MKVLYLTHHFPPETGAAQGRAYDMARNLVNRGHEVTVLTGFPNYPTGVVPPAYRGKKVMREMMDGIKVVRSFMIPDTKKSSLIRLGNYLSFMISGSLVGSFLPKPDVIYASTPPLFVGMAGRALSLRHRVPLVLEVRDLWVDFAKALGELNNASFARLAKSIESRLCRNAKRLVVVTNGYKEHFVRKGVASEKIDVVTNGVDVGTTKVQAHKHATRAAYGLNGEFVVTYAGNLGLAQNLGTVVGAAKCLADRDDIRFVFVGEGVEKERLESQAREWQLPNVQFLGAQSKNVALDLMNASDALLVILKNNSLFHMTIPSKLFDSMAMQRPVLAGVDGEVRQIVEESKAGVYFDSENSESLAKAILQIKGNSKLAAEMGQNGRNVVVGQFDRSVLAGKLEQALLKATEVAKG